MPTFYVSASGSDSANGLSPATAWATIQKANDALPDDGSIVLFERGGTFYGELDLPLGCEVGAYGSGDRPVLTLYKLLNNAGGWSEHAPGVWQIDLGDPDSHGGYTASDDANVGFLLVDGSIKPSLKFDMSELKSQWDFYCDIPNHTLYVAASTNPTAAAGDIKAAPNGNAYGASGCVIYCQRGQNSVHDVHVTGSGGCGIRGAAADVHVHDCLIDFIGGAVLAGYGGGNVRYGNGIEHWRHASRWTIEENEVANVYDVAWSPQGGDLNGRGPGWTDMTIRNNHFHDCGQMFEFWSEGGSDAPGFVRIIVEGNLCERAGYGAFSDVRPVQSLRVHLLTWQLDTPVDITIQNNVFDDAYGSYTYTDKDLPPGFVTRGNTIRLKAGHKIEYQRAETVEQASEWQSATGRETGSTFVILP